ncbi:MAG: SpoIID/LytB domain-containing protein [Lachnospiraceae bacterium]|nr:SpoIID/LytB domain-containing protein [Lachnospiraceae bacterium]
MKYDAKLIMKMSLIFFGLLFLVCIWLGRRERSIKKPEGEKITLEDAAILLEALDIQPPAEFEITQESAGSTEIEEKSNILTYGQYITVYEQLDGERLGLPDYADRYRKDYEMLKEDWYEAYRIMLAHLDTQQSVWETEIFLLKLDEGEGKAYTDNGAMQDAYTYRSTEFAANELRSMKVYVKNNQLLTIVEILPEEHELENVWVAESTDGKLVCFYRQLGFEISTNRSVGREQVADLTFCDGILTEIKEKNEKIHGKLLWVSNEELEIEGSGVYPISEGMEVYKLYGSLETLRRTDLKIGYADTDYVIEKGEVCACLVSENEAADRIRVLLKNTAKGSNYHEEVELYVDGEKIRIEEKDLDVGERRTYQCAALTDRVIVNMKGIEKEDNAYRGTIECYRSAGGMVLINELPLEEYLYAVVPSEMPASYPIESLKAQAVCARTYAYLYILHAGLPEVGAHVDDTTSYQVYHNCSEHIAATTAVKETDGMLLVYQGEPAQNYYYSTSCGIGTDAGIWKSGSSMDLSYMRAIRLNLKAQEDVYPAETLRDEETFRQFITSKDETDLESGEPWYRWTYTVEKIDKDVMLSRIQERYAASPESVLTETKEGYYVSQPIDKLGKIKELSILQRGEGGVADELLVVTDTGTFKILAEYNIRSVLCDKSSEVVRQDGSTTVPSALLPSGFFVIETGKSGESVVGYTLIGGGYGHGVGMSQNGAKALGEEGASYRYILEFFFPGCETKNLGEDE